MIVFGTVLFLLSLLHSGTTLSCYECQDQYCFTSKPVFCSATPPELPELSETSRNSLINRFKMVTNMKVDEEIEIGVHCMAVKGKLGVLTSTVRLCSYAPKHQTVDEICEEYTRLAEEQNIIVETCDVCFTDLCNKPANAPDPPLQCFQCTDGDDPTCATYDPVFCPWEPTGQTSNNELGLIRAAEDYDLVCSKLTVVDGEDTNIIRRCSHSTPKGLTDEAICTKLKNEITTGGTVDDCELCKENLCNGEEIDKTTEAGTGSSEGTTDETHTETPTDTSFQCYVCSDSDRECKNYKTATCTSSESTPNDADESTDMSCGKLVLPDGGNTVTSRLCISTLKGLSDSKICKSLETTMGTLTECHICHTKLCNSGTSIAGALLLLLVAALSALLH